MVGSTDVRGAGPKRPGALSGPRVVEVSHLIAGPCCDHLSADHGAEVIKIEPPESAITTPATSPTIRIIAPAA